MKKIPICYDLGPDSGSDRYTLIYQTERHQRRGRIVYYIGCNSMPYHPAFGIWQYGELSQQYQPHIFAWGRINLRHLGKRVPFETLPEDVKSCYKASYNESTKPKDVAGVYEIKDDGYAFVYNVRPHTGRLVAYTALWVSSAPYPLSPNDPPNRGQYVGRSARIRGRKIGWRNLPPYIVSRFYEQAGTIQNPWQ